MNRRYRPDSNEGTRCPHCDSLPLVGKLFVNGRWIEGRKHFTSVNPATEERVGTAVWAEDSVIAEATQAAASARSKWRAASVRERSDVLRKAARIMTSTSETLEFLIRDEMGKRLAEAKGEVEETAQVLDYYAEIAPDALAPETPLLDSGTRLTIQSTVTHEPYGVVAVISTWNYPLEVPAWAVGAALVAGNTVVFKPSEHTPFVGIKFVEILESAGIPAGVVNLVTGPPEVGRSLASNKSLDMVAFTGSADTGRQVYMDSASHLRKVSLELGGSDPAIICHDADIDLAAAGIVWGRFANSGQVCTAVKRAFVHRDVADRFIQVLVEKTRALRLDIDIAPLVSQAQLERVEAQLYASVSAGARVLCGGKRPPNRPRGHYLLPTVLAEVPLDAPVLTEEVFGPVLPVVIVDNTDEAVNLANDSPYGLGASVWTGSRELGQRLADQLQSGMVWVNDVGRVVPQCPWGGTKQSGFGRGLSPSGIREFTWSKHVCKKRGKNSHRKWWFPYPAKNESVQ